MLTNIQAACTEVLGSVDLAMLLQAVLDLGNMLNSGTKKGGASGFKISNLLRLGDMKSSDKTTTALKFLLIELETQHSVALDTFLQRDMTHLKTASGDGQVRSQQICLNSCPLPKSHSDPNLATLIYTMTLLADSKP